MFAVIDYRSIYPSDIRVGEEAQPERKRTGSPWDLFPLLFLLSYVLLLLLLLVPVSCHAAYTLVLRKDTS